MKGLITTTLLFISLFAIGQTYEIPKKKVEPKPNYQYILIYRQWDSYTKTGNGVAWSEYGWRTHTTPYLTLEEALADLNSSHTWLLSGNKAVNISLEEDQIIGLYKLGDTEKIQLTLDVQHKRLEKHIEVKEEKWIERQYKIKQ